MAYLALEILCNLLEDVEVGLKIVRLLADEQQHVLLHLSAKDLRRGLLREFGHQWQPVRHDKLLHCFDLNVVGHISSTFVKLPQNTRHSIETCS